MSDLIKREDAIAKTFCTAVSGVPRMVVLLDDIKALPSIDSKTKVVAQVTFDEDKLREIVHEAVEQIKEEYDIADRPKGEWEDKEVFNENNDDHYISEWQSARCSNCGKYHTTPYMYYFDNFNFCPNCGADMRGDNNEAD